MALPVEHGLGSAAASAGRARTAWLGGHDGFVRSDRSPANFIQTIRKAPALGLIHGLKGDFSWDNGKPYHCMPSRRDGALRRGRLGLGSVESSPEGSIQETAADNPKCVGSAGGAAHCVPGLRRQSRAKRRSLLRELVRLAGRLPNFLLAGGPRTARHLQAMIEDRAVAKCMTSRTA